MGTKGATEENRCKPRLFMLSAVEDLLLILAYPARNKMVASKSFVTL